ncbi:hypothetical protein CSB07_01560 [Candidatus Gracilibacteria bacterium]|nr:MAG: hypothetical protein CSB07_01560 [Candidatus Gracilibacteria bacterium]PIE85033.1 MAG: hypothetical protein CSA08_03780 [Candidatus Gracilibacteria bacterium]
MKKKEILILLKKSKLFSYKIKKQIEIYADKLNTKQLEAIYQALSVEKTMLLGFLKNLKKSGDLSYEEIKTIKERITKKQMQRMEQSENRNLEESTNKLLLSIENL